MNVSICFCWFICCCHSSHSHSYWPWPFLWHCCWVFVRILYTTWGCLKNFNGLADLPCRFTHQMCAQVQAPTPNDIRVCMLIGPFICNACNQRYPLNGNVWMMLQRENKSCVFNLGNTKHFRMKARWADRHTYIRMWSIVRIYRCNWNTVGFALICTKKIYKLYTNRLGWSLKTKWMIFQFYNKNRTPLLSIG